jgi:hypothetical protein
VAFQAIIQPTPPTPRLPPLVGQPPKIVKELLTLPKVAKISKSEVTGMSADDIRKLLRELSGGQAEEKLPTKELKVLSQPQEKPIFTAPANRYHKLEVEQASESTHPTLEVESTCARPPCGPKWERRIREKLKIDAVEPGSSSLYLRVEIESTETHWKQGICALVDCRATGLFINHEYVKSNRLSTKKFSHSIPVFNVEGSLNEAGCIMEVVELIVRYEKHSERGLFVITSIGRQNLILGITWLREHNPEIDWRTSQVAMSCCLPRCCIRCRGRIIEEQKTLKKETVSINACRAGPFPVTAEDASNDKPPMSDIPFDLEESNRVWAAGLLPEAEYVCATSTISQRLAENFAKNTEPHLTLLTGGRGLKDPIPDYVKIVIVVGGSWVWVSWVSWIFGGFHGFCRFHKF